MAANECYEFGEFLLDVPERRLCRGGESVSLAPKAQDVLVALLRKAGHLVTKRELLEQVWPEAFVEEGILAVHVSALRKALGNGAGNHGYIETVARSGYRFVGPLMQPGSAPPSCPEVEELLIRGRAHLLAGSMYEVSKAITAFRAAIELAPASAELYAGLARACCAQAHLRIALPSEAYARAKAAALRALALNPACGDAQVALGTVLFFSEWDWVGAERSFERALVLDPNHVEAYVLYGQLLEALGKLDDGLQMKRRALQRDSSSPFVCLSISVSYWHQRRYDEAIEWANKTLAINPAHPHAREHLAGAYLKKGDADAWLAENVKHAESHGVPAAALDPLKQAYAAGGRPGVLKLFLERAAGQPQSMPAMQLAVMYAEAGDVNTAFHHLERAIESRDPALVHLAVAPQWDSLRADPRFPQCLARVGLDPVPQSLS